MNAENLKKNAPWIGAGLVLVYFGLFALPGRASKSDIDYAAFGRLPVIDGGRLKPMDTVARTNLMVITHRQAFYDYDTGKRYPATKWMLDALATPPPQDRSLTRIFSKGEKYGASWNYKIFRIENDEVLRMLDLKMRDGLRYSLSEIAPKVDKLIDEVRRIQGDEEAGIKGIDPKKMTLRDAKVMELWQHLNLYIKVSGQNAPLVIPDPEGSDQWKSFRTYFQEVLENGATPGDGKDAQTFHTYARLLLAYTHEPDNPTTFNQLLHEHLAELDKTEPAKMRAIDVEIFFNEFAPFYRALEVYVIIALLGALGWLVPSWSETLRRAAFAGMAVAFLFHLSGLIVRMYLSDRMFVFVTNLYSSAVFIGLGCVFVCLFVEYFYKNGIALVVGSVTGFCTLIIAHMLSLSGDTLEMMQAVLDTNFWLATHVTIITLGYTAAFVAGFMGIAYILLGLFTNMLRGEGSANLTRMTYGVLCAGMFLSFVGTVLGGLWADYSWGRFWGWDPKENGALLIVIWIALILHARWGGMVKHRGIAVLSVLGIIVTSWSWFGTNFLGVGLHSYGFRQGAMAALIAIDLGFLAIAGLGLIPLQNWKSFRAPSSLDPQPPIATAMKAKPKMA